MLQDPLGLYEEGVRRREARHREAQMRALAVIRADNPGWRMAAANALRRVAAKLDGWEREPSTATPAP